MEESETRATFLPHLQLESDPGEGRQNVVTNHYPPWALLTDTWDGP
jgi:hypothetical protein